MKKTRISHTKSSKELLRILQLDLAQSKTYKKVTMNLSKELFWSLFKENYKIIKRKAFKLSPDAVNNLKPLALYFLQDKKFLDSKNLDAENSKPSLEKGLLLTGKVGNGKTSFMEAIKNVLSATGNKTFFIKNCKQIVLEFESCNNQNDKKYFYEQYLRGVILFDDLGSENKASNFGIVDVVKEILFLRDERQLLTHATTNLSISDLGERYDMRIEDRIYDMFNIINFQGKSMRGRL